MAPDVARMEAHYMQRRAMLDAEYRRLVAELAETEKEIERRTHYLRKEFAEEEQRLTERLAWLERRVDAADVADSASWWAVVDRLCPSTTKGLDNEKAE